MSPEQTSTPQDESMATPKMSVPASPVAGTPIRDAQSPISLLLAVAQSHNRNGDDDLTSLSWLHERDLLKGMNINPSPSNSVNSTPVKYNNNNNISNSNNNNNNSSLLSDQFPTSDYVDDSSISAAESSSSSLNSPTPQQQPKSQQQQQQQMYHNGNNSVQRTKHPHNIPYDPLIHTNNKPPYSFSCLIFMAIEDSTQKALPVKEIYAWILEHFPYFKNAPTGWKNSVRHNLSLNKCFQKVEKAPNLGKGSLWTVDQQYRPNLIQALTRSPFHPCSTLDPSIYFNNNNNNTVNNNNGNNKQTTTTIISERTPTRLPNPELYPYLSKKLAASAVQLKNNFVNIKSEPISDESLDAVDAAAVMLSLKNGPRYRQKKEKHLWQVITTSPSQDHTYSAADTAITTTTIQQKQESLIADEAFESDDEVYSKSTICRKLDFDDEEERKIKEGAETLLNLAGITTRKRYNSNNDNGDDYYYNNNNNKCLKLSPKYEIDENDEKPVPFKPRLLRTKKKDSKVIINSNNNNDEWVKHRRELENNQHR